MKKILFLISHPAHFHLFRLAIAELQKNGNKAIIVIRPKDVLEQLCIDSGLNYIRIKSRPKKYGFLGLAISLLKKDFDVYRLVKETKPDLLIGSDGTLERVGFISRIPSFEFSEDDAEAVKLYALLSFPFYTNIVSPEVTSAWWWNSKKIGCNSYHELAYLHPNHFEADKVVANRYVNVERNYFIIRLAQLTAHHDAGITGINNRIARKLVELLKPHGDIYITSERELDPEFEQYRIKINPLDMHHVIAFAEIYIGDSQTMAAEAGVLGVPFVRFNDFVGRLSYLNELENHYQLGIGVRTNKADRLFSSVSELIDMPDRKNVFALRRARMLAEKADYSKFLTWFIENYPQSAVIMKENPDYQRNFK